MKTQPTKATFSDLFSFCSTVEAVKKTYREQALRFHPDTASPDASAEAFNYLNEAYLDALKARDNESCVGDDGKTHTYRYNAEQESGAMAVIADLLRLRMTDVDILLIGSWVWVIGATKPHKEQIKGIGKASETYSCDWHKERVCWYFKPTNYRSFSSNADLGTLAARYGYKVFSGDDSKAAAKVS